MRRGLSPEYGAALQQWAFRAYNACETGDIENSKAVFEELEREKRALDRAGAAIVVVGGAMQEPQ